MKKIILIFVVSLFISCNKTSSFDKNDYKVIFTFSHFDKHSNKILKSEPVEFFVVAKDSTELVSAIRDTLSKAYCLDAQDIAIKSFEKGEKNNSRNFKTLNFYLPEMGNSYSYINHLTKTYVLKGDLTTVYNKYSPERYRKEILDRVFLTVKNHKFKLSDYNGNILLSFEISSLNDRKKFMKRLIFDSENHKSIPFIFVVDKIIEPDYISQKHYLVDTYHLRFTGNNKTFQNIQVSLVIEYNDSFEDVLFVNQMYIKYSKNEIDYTWLLNHE